MNNLMWNKGYYTLLQSRPLSFTLHQNPSSGCKCYKNKIKKKKKSLSVLQALHPAHKTDTFQNIN